MQALAKIIASLCHGHVLPLRPDEDVNTLAYLQVLLERHCQFVEARQPHQGPMPHDTIELYQLAAGAFDGFAFAN